ncbi:extracellular solute-binding protein [Kribbella sp. NBC_00662]|uniref:ABC transporter substrate-binding protein n=1 Tax=Kribbella sp. NBC_00662 TaxID=2975969 RepID=UPI003252C699
MSSPLPSISRRSVLRLAGGIGAAALAAPVLAACGGSTGSGSSKSASLRFMFWGSDDRVKRFQKACTAFTDKNPSIKVSPEFGDIDAIETKLTVAMSGNNLPDVFWVTGDLLPQLVAGGHVMDLTPHLGAGKGIADAGFTDAIKAPGQIDGKQYAMTHGLQSIGLFAKKNILDEVGVPVKNYPDSYSWDEYAQISAKIHAAKGAKFFGTDDPNTGGAADWFGAYARQHDQDMWAASGDLGFTKDLMTEWLTYWKNLRDTKASVPAALALEQNPYFEGAPMIRGLAAYHMRNSNQMLELQGLTKDPLVLMPCPGNGGSGNKAIELSPNMLCVAAKTKNPDAALKFADYLLNDVDRAKIVGTTIGSPPTKAVRDAIASSVTDAEKQFLTYIGFEAEAKSLPVRNGLPTSGAFTSDMVKAWQNLGYDKASIPQTVDLIFGDLRTKLLKK